MNVNSKNVKLDSVNLFWGHLDYFCIIVYVRFGRILFKYQYIGTDKLIKEGIGPLVPHV